MAKYPLAGHAATVVHRAGLHLEFVIIGNNDPSFTRSHQLAGLETEGARDSECPHPLSAPFTGVRMRRVFDQRQSLAGGDFFQPIEISRMIAFVLGVIAASTRSGLTQ